MKIPFEIAGGTDSAADDSTLAPTAESWVEEQDDRLYRYAPVRVRKLEVAENLVQETFRAAVRTYDKFGGRSSVRSRLGGVLKHKIIDRYRNAGRKTSFTDLEFLSDELSQEFVPQECWRHEDGPVDWHPDASEVMEQGDFWQAMQRGLAKLPAKIANVFSMRGMKDIPSKEICALLSITKSKLWVMLHRARMELRECLGINWFVPGNPGNL